MGQFSLIKHCINEVRNAPERLAKFFFSKESQTLPKSKKNNKPKNNKKIISKKNYAEFFLIFLKKNS